MPKRLNFEKYTFCETCDPKPFKPIYVKDVKNPHCLDCGRDLLRGYKVIKNNEEK